MKKQLLIASFAVCLGLGAVALSHVWPPAAYAQPVAKDDHSVKGPMLFTSRALHDAAGNQRLYYMNPTLGDWTKIAGKTKVISVDIESGWLIMEFTGGTNRVEVPLSAIKCVTRQISDKPDEAAMDLHDTVIYGQ